MVMLDFRSAALAAITLPLVWAVSLNDLPKCAQNAASSALASTPCGLLDFQCICSYVPFVSALSASVQQTCSAADQQGVLSFGQALCGPYGVNLHVPAIAAADTVAPSAAPSSAAAPAPSPTNVAAVDNSNGANPAIAPAPGAATSSSAIPVSPSDLSDSDSISAPSATATSTPSAAPSSYIVYDTNSVFPSVTIDHSSSAITDAVDPAQQYATPTRSYHANATTNATVAASSPIPYVGAAVSSNVQSTGMVLMAILGLCWGL
ncbi:MAG: hypothetical protein Q9194_001065 [Teloschistes cf. exilis]